MHFSRSVIKLHRRQDEFLCPCPILPSASPHILHVETVGLNIKAPEASEQTCLPAQRKNYQRIRMLYRFLQFCRVAFNCERQLRNYKWVRYRLTEAECPTKVLEPCGTLLNLFPHLCDCAILDERWTYRLWGH